MLQSLKKQEPSDFKLDTFSGTIGSNKQAKALCFYVPSELFKQGDCYSFSINKASGVITLTPDMNGNIMSYPSKKAQGRMYITFGAKHHGYSKTKLRNMKKEIVDAVIFTDGRVEFPVPKFEQKKKPRKAANDSAKTELKVVRTKESPASLLKRVNDLISKKELKIQINDDGLLTYAVTDFILPC